LLKWARAHQCPWNERTCSYAVRNGHLETLNGPGLINAHGMNISVQVLLIMVT